MNTRIRGMFAWLISVMAVALVALCPTSCLAQTSQPTVVKETIPGAGGDIAALVASPVLAKGQKCPFVIISHGFGGTKEAYLLKVMADSLLAHGIGSVRFDYIGHGESYGSFQEMTVPKENDDLKRVFRHVLNMPQCNGVIALAGHSQGGVVTSMVAGDLGNRVAAVVLLAPAAVLRDDAIRGNTFGATYNPLDPPEYVTVGGGHKLGREFIQTAFWLPIYETAAKYHGPACIIHGTADRIVPFTYGLRYHETWVGSEWHLLNGFDHGLSQDNVRIAKISTDFLTRFLK